MTGPAQGLTDDGGDKNGSTHYNVTASFQSRKQCQWDQQAPQDSFDPILLSRYQIECRSGSSSPQSRRIHWVGSQLNS